MKQNTPTNTQWPLQQRANRRSAGDTTTGMIMPNDCYLAGKAAFAQGLGVRDCPHRGPNGQAWLRGWHVAQLMRKAYKHLDAHTERVE